jgi:hypothetical protein
MFTIDCNGQRLTLQLAETIINALRTGGNVSIINCAGADVLELATALMLMAERQLAVEAPNAAP